MMEKCLTPFLQSLTGVEALFLDGSKPAVVQSADTKLKEMNARSGGNINVLVLDEVNSLHKWKSTAAGFALTLSSNNMSMCNIFILITNIGESSCRAACLPKDRPEDQNLIRFDPSAVDYEVRVLDYIDPALYFSDIERDIEELVWDILVIVGRVSF